MNKSQKILLSIPSIIGLLFMFVYIFPTKFSWLLHGMNSYYIWVGSINTAIFTTVIILIRRLWTFKKVDKSTRWIWTLNMMFFHALAILVYVWKVDKQMITKNQKLSQRTMR